MPHPRPTHRRPRGVSLIEFCVVAAVIGVLASSAAPGLQSLVDGRRLQGAATQLATDLQFVRSEAVARNQPVRLSLYSGTAGSCVVIHTGDAAGCRCDWPGPAHCTVPAQAVKSTFVARNDRVALVWNAGSLLFDPLHGTVTPTATLRVVGAQGREIRHVVNVMGRVRSCSPNAVVAAYRAC